MAKHRLENSRLTATFARYSEETLAAEAVKVSDDMTCYLKEVSKKALVISMHSTLFDSHPPELNHACSLSASLENMHQAQGLVTFVHMLPTTLTVILGFIANIARREGESIYSIETRLACMEVLALYVRDENALNAVELGYYGIRGWLAASMSNAAQFIANRGFEDAMSPSVDGMIAQIAERFTIALSEVWAALALPGIDGKSGAFMHVLFVNAFKELAHGHFAIRRLERKFGVHSVANCYQNL